MAPGRGLASTRGLTSMSAIAATVFAFCRGARCCDGGRAGARFIPGRSTVLVYGLWDSVHAASGAASMAMSPMAVSKRVHSDHGDRERDPNPVV